MSLVWLFGYREKASGFQFGVMMLTGQETWFWVQRFMGLGFGYGLGCMSMTSVILACARPFQLGYVSILLAPWQAATSMCILPSTISHPRKSLTASQEALNPKTPTRNPKT